MGSAQAQGQLWGAQARNWADLMEKMSLPIYHVVLDKTNVGRGTRLLDIGCGTGMLAQLAAQLGASVSGLDASEAELVTTLKAAMACLPPPPPGTRGPFSLSAPGKLESLMEEAGLTVCAKGDVSCPYEYPDEEMAWKTISSAGPIVIAIRAAGEETIKQAVINSLAPFKRPEGGYRQENLMHYAIATV